MSYILVALASGVVGLCIGMAIGPWVGRRVSRLLAMACGF